MGIVTKQASISAFLGYAGVVIGFVNLTLLMANWFTPVQVGLREVLLSVAVFGSQIAHFGTYRSLVKFYPFFKSNQGNYDNGLLRIGLTVPLFGFIVVSGIIILFKSQIVDYYIEKSPLFIEYFWFSFPLIFMLLFNNVFESYLQARSKTAYSVFLKSVLTRLLTSFLLVLYYFSLIDFYQFIVCFIFSYIVTIVLFIISLYQKGEFSLKLNPNFFTRRVRKLYFQYSSFSILSGVASVLLNRIDILMISSIIGLASTSVYANAVYLSVLVAIPGDSIAKITMPLLSKSWKSKNIGEIKNLYQKTSATQYLLGGLLLILMWGSIDNFYSLQREEYAEGKIVFLILGFAKLMNMLFGANGQIISISKFYRFDTFTAILLGLLTVYTNHIFIPEWGIEGAAAATGLSLLLFNMIRFYFVYTKLKIQPFTKSTILISFVLLIGFVTNYLLPNLNHFILDTIYRSIIIAIVIVVPAYFLKVSEDFNHLILKNLNRLIKR